MVLRRLARAQCWFAVLALQPVLPAAAQVGQGGEVQVHVHTTGSQGTPAVAARYDGSFVVAWQSYYDGRDGVFLRRLDSHGAVLGSEIEVSPPGSGLNRAPSLASDEDGRVIVAWDKLEFSPLRGEIWTRRLDRNGVALGDAERVDDGATRGRLGPAVAADPIGRYVVVWQDGFADEDGADGEDAGIVGRRYARSGVAQSDPFVVNTSTAGKQESPAVARADNGDFVVVWSGQRPGTGFDIQGQRYRSDGVPLGGEFVINTAVAGYQTEPAVAMLPDRGFVVAWSGYGYPHTTNGADIFLQRFDAAGSPVGGETLVNLTTLNRQENPTVAADEAGGYVVAWESFDDELGPGQDGDSRGVYTQRFAADGSHVGGELQVNDVTTNGQSRAAVAMDPGGDFLISWQSSRAFEQTEKPDQDGDDAGIYAKHFTSECVPGPSTLCLQDGRYKVEASFLTGQGDVGRAQVVPGGSPDAGLLWFFQPDNWEMLIKVLDGCSNNGNIWVFAAATTGVGYTLRVTDTVHGNVVDYTNPVGTAAAAITDTSALPCVGRRPARTVRLDGDPTAAAAMYAQLAAELGVGNAAKPRQRASVGAAPGIGLPVPAGVAACEPDATHLCLSGGRFRVGVSWETRQGATGAGMVVPSPAADDSGLFWFFRADNWEMLVKVLDGCSFNDRYWVLAAATTNVGYTLTVTDTESGESAVYENEIGVSSPAIVDNQALAVCP